MATGSFGPIPYIPDFNNLAVDAFVCFVVSALLAILINAEAQGWMATLLGDVREDTKDRLHFNVFFHLSFPGSLCYLIGGFGWPKPIEVDTSKFQHPLLYTVLTRFAGPVANILLASIAASLASVIIFLEMEPLVFAMVVGVNLTTAVYHLIPIPPMAAGSLITAWFPAPSPLKSRVIYYSGSVIILAVFLMERISGVGIISPYLNPIVQAVARFLLG